MLFWRAKSKNEIEAEAREEQLWKELTQGKGRSSEEAKKAIAYCRDCIQSYDEWFEHNEARWLAFQRVIIIGGVIATLSGIATIPEDWIKAYPALGSFGWLRGIPAAIVTISAGFLSSFTYREDAVRNEVTANTLRNELVKFVCKSTPYDEDNELKATSKFLNKVCLLVDSELQSWSALVTSSRNSDT